MNPVARVSLLSWLLLALANAQAQDKPPLALQSSSLLQERIDDATRQQLPTFLQSDRMTGRTDLETQLEGKASVRRGDLLIRAEHMDYDQTRDYVTAHDHVYINRQGNTYQGPALELQLDSFEGFFTQPDYTLSKNKLHGHAERADFIDSGNTVLHKADLTSCERKPGPGWTPDWFFKGDSIALDTDRNIGRADGASLIFKGVPILPIPSIDFPLNNERKSGFLPPTIGLDNISGLEYTQPYYWNLAPNRDITLTPTYWSKRGLRLNTEFRYLEGQVPQPPFYGTARIDLMPNDALRNGAQRWAMQYSHMGVLNPAVAGGNLGLTFNINRVSDDNYWKDFALSSNSGVQRLLSNDVNATWGNGIVTTTLTVQRWQTLQDLSDPTNANGTRITPPFDRVPQLGVTYQRTNLQGSGLDVSLFGQATRFESIRNNSLDTDQPNCTNANCNGSRAVSVLQVSRPFIAPYGYLTPKLQVTGRNYQFDQALTNGQSTAGMSVPTFSLDASLVYERPQTLFSRSWIQTLEPRAFYVYTPYRDQNYLPNYDSGSNAYNFASIFTENTFGGYDRISDSKMVTVGATSRLIDPDTGAEGARFALAQRVRLKDEHVVINPTTDTAPSAGLNDFLVGAGVNLTKAWSLDSLMEYNPKTSNYLRRMVGGHYSLGPYRVVSAAYRTQNNDDGSAYSRQLDVGWQWPLRDLWRGRNDEDLGEGRGLGEGRWYSVAHLNYSGLDHTFVESVLGFEYDAGCWLGRIVSERLQVATGVTQQRLLFQLEFVGLSRLGTNALGSLRTNVQRYQPLRATPFDPSRFGNYD